MRVEIEKITLTIEKKEAYDIINCLTESLDMITGKKNYPEAYALVTRLRGLFMSSVKGIHYE